MNRYRPREWSGTHPTSGAEHSLPVERYIPYQWSGTPPTSGAVHSLPVARYTPYPWTGTPPTSGAVHPLPVERYTPYQFKATLPTRLAGHYTPVERDTPYQLYIITLSEPTRPSAILYLVFCWKQQLRISLIKWIVYFIGQNLILPVFELYPSPLLPDYE